MALIIVVCILGILLGAVTMGITAILGVLGILCIIISAIFGGVAFLMLLAKICFALLCIILAFGIIVLIIRMMGG